MNNVTQLVFPNEDARNEVASSVRSFIARAGISKSAVARAIGMTQSTFSRRTNGNEPFDIDELGLLAEYFGVTLVELISADITKIAPNAKKAPTRMSGGLLVGAEELESPTLSVKSRGLAEIIPIRRAV